MLGELYKLYHEICINGVLLPTLGVETLFAIIKKLLKAVQKTLMERHEELSALQSMINLNASWNVLRRELLEPLPPQQTGQAQLRHSMISNGTGIETDRTGDVKDRKASRALKVTLMAGGSLLGKKPKETKASGQVAISHAELVPSMSAKSLLAQIVDPPKPQTSQSTRTSLAVRRPPNLEVPSRLPALPMVGSQSAKNANQMIRLDLKKLGNCLLYTSPSPRDRQKSRMPSSA
eukprot:TRINITY_DN12496_c0_g1_i1.p1 TRINITY_DN12496_c0_g1~~TRINITY_DN12496_c0_g1_i1.p1  ORF type:complete len:234 (+),score=52.95 TRINITY_DN12496_c0_g1_i1:155-856(+)